VTSTRSGGCADEAMYGVISAQRPARSAENIDLMETLLEGHRIVLRPLQYSDADALVRAAADGELWNLIVLKDTGKVIGSTRFWKVDRLNRKLEIGSSWIGASWQKTFVNTEAKYLMLRHAFEVLDCVRVQFTTDENNQKSRNAILRLGAQQEGIVRHERIMPDGRKRNSVRFSIIDDEWPLVRQNLEKKLADFNSR
jgi:hypothetical protein